MRYALFSLQSDSRSLKANAFDIAVRFIYAKLFWLKKGLLLHSAGIIKDKRAFLFLGSCGSGKTTIARNSGKYPLLSDEMVGIKQEGEEFYAFSTPWGNEARAGRTNTFTAVVKKIFFLHKDKSLWFKNIPSSEAMATALAGNHHIVFFLQWAEKDEIAAIISSLSDLVKCIPVWEMHFTKNVDFWRHLPERG
ncbi:MAG: hypothetical protein WC335_04400 [Candidatus Omnitrophota bacterium]